MPLPSSKSSLGSRDSYSPASQSFARLVLMSFVGRLMTLHYEIFGLVRGNGEWEICQ
ncbi:MAG: hypothetical protein QE493_05920 [Verrucomicrobiae bacterium]|nr:hypothetical protein [Verrucomicrobiae bacterium]